jgi:hypothetical protein
MEGQSNTHHRFGYCRRDRIRCLVGLSGCAAEGWEGGCACGVGPDLTACDYVALAPRSAQPTERLGVGVVGLLCPGGGTANPLKYEDTRLSPVPLAGLLFRRSCVGFPT